MAMKIIWKKDESLYYRRHKTNRNCGGSYIVSPAQMKIKKATINPINKKDSKCFQYAITVALNHEEIKKKSSKNNPKFNLL